MYATYRVRQIKTNTIIVHRRKGRAKVRSKFDIQFGYSGHWRLLCGRFNYGGVNVTTDDRQVTCMHCLKRME